MLRARFRLLLASTTLTAALVSATQSQAQSSGTAGAGDTSPNRAGKLTKAPQLLNFKEVEAPYPPSERASEKSAEVVLQIAISDRGEVQEVVIVTTAGPSFDTAAIESAKRFKFTPAEIDGRAAPVKITFKYSFEFKDEIIDLGPQINYSGEVLDSTAPRKSPRPLPGITVTVFDVKTDDAGKKTRTKLAETETDDEGYFEFEGLPAGTYTVVVAGPAIASVETEETIQDKKGLEVKYKVEPKGAPDEDEITIEVIAPRIQKETTTVAIKTEEARRVPGTGGEALRVVQNLPGVARAAFGSGALVVWGAAPQDTRVYLDGARLPLLYHVGGFRATVNSDLVRAIELAPGGYGAEYGRGLGGLVTVDSRALKADGFHGYAAADLIDASALVETPLDGKTRIAVAARKSYLSQTLGVFTKEDVSELVPIPSFYDAQVKIERDLGENETLSLIALTSNDKLRRTVTNPDPAQTISDERTTVFHRLIGGYRRAFADGSSFTLTPSIGTDSFGYTQKFGSTPTEQQIDAVVFGLRAKWRGKVHPTVLMNVGVDIEGTQSKIRRRGAVVLPPREGDITVFGQPPNDVTNFDDWNVLLASVAPYAQADWELFGNKLHVVPGLRMDSFLVNGDKLYPTREGTEQRGYLRNENVLEPRLAIRYQASEKLSFKAAYGQYHQPPVAEDLSPVFGNPNLGFGRATHYLGGFTYRPIEKLSAEVTVFTSQSANLSARSPAPSPLVGEALTNTQDGRAYGGQILLRQELTAHFFGWVSYSLIRSERKDREGTPWRLFDYDQTHVATVVGSYELPFGFEVGARVRYATGFPRTPVQGAYYNSRRDLYEPYFGSQNSIRIPSFFQADARISKRFVWPKAKLEIYADVQNLTNRQNREDIVYNYDYSVKNYITGLPTLAVVGARLEW